MTTSVWHEVARDLPCAEAAELLGMPPGALERWARELEFPSDVGGGGGAPRFPREEIETLRETLASAHSVEGAIREARSRLGR